MTLPSTGAVTWDELIAEMSRLSGQDRDGDGVNDKPFCFRWAASWHWKQLLQYIATSFFQVRSQDEGIFFDLKDLEPLLSMEAWKHVARIYVDIRNMENMDNPVYPGGDQDYALYIASKCVIRLDFAGDENPASYVTPVGSTRVQNRKGFHQYGTDEMIDCTPIVCPDAVPGTGGVLVNKAHPVLQGGWGWTVSQRTSRPENTWKLLEFFMQEKVTFHWLLQGAVTC